MISPLIAASSAANPPLDGLSVGLAVVLVAVLVFGGRLWMDHRRQRQALELRIRNLLAERPQMSAQNQQEDRNTVLFEQHRRMNELQVAKLAAEVELLGRQVKANSLNEDRLEASKEYHELMVEKTKLEIDSMRLHITELRRRIEDWRLGDE